MEGGLTLVATIYISCSKTSPHLLQLFWRALLCHEAPERSCGPRNFTQLLILPWGQVDDWIFHFSVSCSFKRKLAMAHTEEIPMLLIFSSARLPWRVAEGGVRGSGVCWQQSKLNKDENMIGSISAADGGTKPLLRMIPQNCRRTRGWKNRKMIWRTGTFSLADLCKKKQKNKWLQYGVHVCSAQVESIISIFGGIGPSTDVSARRHCISVFNQLLIIKVSGPTADVPP